jgi:hypothetical protein
MLILQKFTLCLETNNRGKGFRIKREGDVRNVALYKFVKNLKLINNTEDSI